ncbi:hypothetical protein MJO28_015043, partial [Puccinia striiformis f. sp. tritici]
SGNTHITTTFHVLIAVQRPVSIATSIKVRAPGPQPARMTGPEITTAPLTQKNLTAHTNHPPLSQSAVDWLRTTLKLHSSPCFHTMSTSNHYTNDQVPDNDRFTQLEDDELDDVIPPSQFWLSQLSDYFCSPPPPSPSHLRNVDVQVPLSPTPGNSAPVPDRNRIRPNPSQRVVIKLPIEYSVWVHDALPVTRRAAGSGNGRPPPEWAKVASKLPLDVWTASPKDYDWGLAKHEIIEVIGPTRPYLGRKLTIADQQGLLTWYAVITGHTIYGVGRKFAIVSEADWLGFATAAEAVFPTKQCFIKILQPDPRAVACNQARVSEGNEILILRNGNASERAPLEQTRNRLAANPNAVVAVAGRDHAVRLREHHLSLRQERGAPSREGEYAMHPSLDGRYIRLSHRVVWACACALEVAHEGVTLDIPPPTALFTWEGGRLTNHLRLGSTIRPATPSQPVPHSHTGATLRPASMLPPATNVCVAAGSQLATGSTAAVQPKRKAAPVQLHGLPASRAFRGAGSGLGRQSTSGNSGAPVDSVRSESPSNKSSPQILRRPPGPQTPSVTRVLHNLSAIGNKVFGPVSRRPSDSGASSVVPLEGASNGVDILDSPSSPEISFVPSCGACDSRAPTEGRNITPLNLAKLSNFHLSDPSPAPVPAQPQFQPRPTAHEARHLPSLTMDVFLDWPKITRLALSLTITTSQLGRTSGAVACTQEDLVALGFKAGPAWLIVEGIFTIKESIPEKRSFGKGKGRADGFNDSTDDNSRPSGTS